MTEQQEKKVYWDNFKKELKANAKVTINEKYIKKNLVLDKIKVYK